MIRWLELIRLRATHALTRQMPEDLSNYLEFLKDEAGLIEAKLYGGIQPDGDFSLALLWETEGVQPCGSLIAQRLIPQLRRYGLINHTVWIENKRIGFSGSAGNGGTSPAQPR